MNLGAISTLVFDLDGVVWRGDSPIDSAITAINELRAAGKRCLYCTNNSSQTQAAFVAKLTGMGIEGVTEEDVITSSVATATYLSAQFTGPFLAYVVGGEGIRLALQKIGARIVPDSDVNGDSQVDCVIVGIDREFNYEKLSTAQRLIRRGALFVATNRDATYPIEDGVIPGSGAIVSAVETAAGSTPVTIGKPRPVMLQLVMQKFNLEPHELVFIGDRLDTDIVCARRAGVPALLVTTGVTTLQEARRAKGEMRPDAVFPDLISFNNVLLGRTPTEAPAETAAAATAVVAETATVDETTVVPESEPMVEEAPAETEIAVEAEPSVEAELPAETELSLDNEVPFASAPSLEAAPDLAFNSESEFELSPQLSSEPAPEAPVAASAEDDPLAAALPAESSADEWDDTWFAETEAKIAAGETDGETESAATPARETASSETASSETSEEEKSEESTPASGNFDWKLD